MSTPFLVAIGTSSTGMTHRTMVRLADETVTAKDVVKLSFRITKAADCSSMGNVRRTIISRMETLGARSVDELNDGRPLCSKCFPGQK